MAIQRKGALRWSAGVIKTRKGCCIGYRVHHQQRPATSAGNPASLFATLKAEPQASEEGSPVRSRRQGVNRFLKASPLLCQSEPDLDEVAGQADPLRRRRACRPSRDVGVPH